MVEPILYGKLRLKAERRRYLETKSECRSRSNGASAASLLAHSDFFLLR